MTVVEVLKGMRELITDIDCWNRGEYALDHKGRGVDARDENACSWCLVGALRYFCSGDNEYDNIWDDICQKVGITMDYFIHANYGFQTAARFNDAKTVFHEDVLEMLDRLIVQVESNEA